MSTALGESTWPDLPARPLVLVPVGSTEQHGPHLPTSTDTLVATATAEGLSRVLASAEHPVLVAPPLAYGSSGEHQGFAGTVSIGADALHLVIIELVRSLSTWAGRVVLVNGHGGNVDPLSRAVTQLRRESHDVAWVPCTVGGGDLHAGFTETCLVMHLAPHLVRLERAVVGNVATLAELMPALTTAGVRAVSASGVLGDPIGANAAEGERLLGAMVGAAARRLSVGAPDGRGCLVVPSERAAS